MADRVEPLLQLLRETRKAGVIHHHGDVEVALLVVEVRRQRPAQEDGDDPIVGAQCVRRAARAAWAGVGIAHTVGRGSWRIPGADDIADPGRDRQVPLADQTVLVRLGAAVEGGDVPVGVHLAQDRVTAATPSRPASLFGFRTA